MANKAKKKVIPPLDTEKDTEKDKHHSNSAKLAAEEQRQKLLNQIAMLKTYISVLEHKFETLKFGQLKLPSSLHKSKAVTRRDVPDVRIELQRDLYKFTGIQCVKCKNNFVFEIFGTNDISSKNLYAVQILIDDQDRGKLGKWVLPMFVDVEEILSRHPIEDLNNVRQFLKSCKHHVDCYICRVKQQEELRNFLAEVKNARMSTIGIALVELEMLGVKDIENDAIRNVKLYLRYNSAEVRPYQLLSDTNDNERPSADLFKRLNKYFKPFLKNDLNAALQRVIESQTKFLWKPIATEKNENDSDISESLEDAGYLSAYLRDKKETKKKQKGSKNKKRDERSVLQDNETETSLRVVESEQCEDIDVKKNKRRDDFSADDKKIKPRKRKPLATTITKSLDAEKSDDLRKTENEAADTGKRNGAGEANKSKLKVTSAASPVWRHKQSKKCQIESESAQTENNYALLRDENNDGNNRNSPRKTDDKHGKATNGKLLAESNDMNNEDVMSPQRMRKRRRAITPIAKRDEKDRTISNSSEKSGEVRINVSNSTPFTMKLPDKQKFFHVSHISEIKY